MLALYRWAFRGRLLVEKGSCRIKDSSPLGGGYDELYRGGYAAYIATASLYIPPA
jgi:hypothetical protein